MSDTQTLPLGDVRALLSEWERHLKSVNKAPSTIKSYLGVAAELAEFLLAAGMPTMAASINREHIEAYIVHLQERPNRRTGKPLSAAMVAKHYRSLQQLFRWLEDVEGEIQSSPFAKMSPPAVPEQPTPVMTEDQLRALIATCPERGTFEQRRDRALIMLFIDTGARCGEIAPLRVDDVDFDGSIITVMGKGRRRRDVPFGEATRQALKHYRRARSEHPLAGTTDAWWIGKKGPLTEWGIRQLLNRRADDAKIPHVNPHAFRHAFAHRWLAEGGQEQDLMRLAGWRSREMVARYGASAADERARSAHQRANLIDRLVSPKRVN